MSQTEAPYDEDQKCRVCSCTNDCACVWAAEPQPPGPMVWAGPCEWVEYDLCSQCAPTVLIEEAPEGDPGMEAVQEWFRNGGC